MSGTQKDADLLDDIKDMLSEILSITRSSSVSSSGSSSLLQYQDDLMVTYECSDVTTGPCDVTNLGRQPPRGGSRLSSDRDSGGNDDLLTCNQRNDFEEKEALAEEEVAVYEILTILSSPEDEQDGLLQETDAEDNMLTLLRDVTSLARDVTTLSHEVSSDGDEPQPGEPDEPQSRDKLYSDHVINLIYNQDKLMYRSDLSLDAFSDYDLFLTAPASLRASLSSLDDVVSLPHDVTPLKKKKEDAQWMIGKIENLIESDRIIASNIQHIRDSLHTMSRDNASLVSKKGGLKTVPLEYKS